MATAWEVLEEVPDLLRRFVYTPYRASLCLGEYIVEIGTNDQAISRQLQSTGKSRAEIGRMMQVRAIIDEDLNLPLDSTPAVMDTGYVIWGMRPGMLFSLDRQTHEATIFMLHFVTQNFYELLTTLLSETTTQP